MAKINSTIKDYCVYIHRKATDKTPFYVGKGVTGKRPYATHNRSEIWKRTASKYGVIVEIFILGLQEWAAHEIECELIALHGRRDLNDGPLVNLTNGGEGSSLVSKESMDNRSANKEYLKKLSITSRAFWGLDSSKKLMSDSAISTWLDPVVRKKRSDGIRKDRSKPFICIETGNTYPTLLEAAKWIHSLGKIKAHPIGIHLALQGKLKKAYKFTWKYI